MKQFQLLIAMLCVLAAGSAQAQLYKWVGPDGKVNYTDAPPPPSAKQLETKPLDSGAVNTSGLPYELAQAAKNHPVTLYTGDNCPPCNEGRAMLNARGIPFAEKTVNNNDDLARLRQVGGEANLPLLTVGRNKQKGFSAPNWNSALSAAGYPEVSKLPKTYQNPAATPAAPSAPVAKAASKNAPMQSDAPVQDVPPPVGNAPPGFRF